MSDAKTQLIGMLVAIAITILCCATTYIGLASFMHKAAGG